MSQRLIVAIGISGFVGVLLLVALNVLTLLPAGPAANPRIGARPTPSPTVVSSAPPSSRVSATPGASGTAGGASATPQRTSGGPTETPAPTAITGSAQDQSAGEISLRIDSPLGVQLTSAAVCAWAADPPLRVAEIRSAEGAALDVAGERVSIVVTPGSATVPVLISRAGSGASARAPYGISAANPTGVTISGETDRHLGEAAFHGLRTTSDAIPPDRLPVRRAVYAQPLGGQATAEAIDGAVSWQCGAAPAGYEPRPTEPSASASPSTAREGYPRVTLTAASGLFQAGVPWCGSTTAADGTTSTESCDSAWPAPLDYPDSLPAGRGTPLRIIPESGWRIASWNVTEATQADVEANLGKPTREIALATGARRGSPVGSLLFRAPATGIWIIRARLTADGPGRSEATTTWFFLIRAT